MREGERARARARSLCIRAGNVLPPLLFLARASRARFSPRARAGACSLAVYLVGWTEEALHDLRFELGVATCVPYLLSGALFYLASRHMDDELPAPRAPPDVRARHEKGGYDDDCCGGGAAAAAAAVRDAQEKEPLIARNFSRESSTAWA